MARSLTHEFGKFASHLRYEDLPDEVIEKSKTSILHGLAVGLAGYDIDHGHVAIKMAKQMGGKYTKGATLLVDGSRLPPQITAFANAALFECRVQSDTYEPGHGHVGPVIIPPALAVGEIRGRSGKDLVTAVAAGYEVIARVSKGFGSISTSRGFRATALYGPIGAAASAGKMLGLDEDQMTHAVGWGANCGCGLFEWATAGSSEPVFQDAFVASNGVTSAFLGQAGAVPAERILEGDKGFYRTFLGERVDAGRIIDELGKRYDMLSTVIKRHLVGSHSQTPASALLALVNEYDFSPDEVQKVTLVMNPEDITYPGLPGPEPALTKPRYVASVICIKKEMSAAAIAQFDDPHVLAFIPKVNIVTDEKRETLSCRVLVELNDGRILEKELAPGEKGYLFSLDEEVEWVRKSLIREIPLEKEKVHGMIETVKDLEACANLGELMRLLVSPRRKSARIKLIV